jgi:hypothetical protein
VNGVQVVPGMRFVPIEDLRARDGTFSVYVDWWWLTYPQHGLAFYGNAPQCNKSEILTERVGSRYPWAVVVRVPLVFVPHNCADYL